MAKTLGFLMQFIFCLIAKAMSQKLKKNISIEQKG